MKNLIVLILAASALAGCSTLGLGGGKGEPLQNAASQPAAEGTLKTSVGKNDNTEIDLKVKHLAHPEKLQKPASSYVVWTQRDDKAPPQNIGALQVDKNLTGTLNTKTPLHKFDLFITQEPNGVVDHPTGDKQLWTSFSR
jgi:hypothetical protein